ncbi:unnamed protein product [Lactuca virosa]|uniref:D-fructose-1,6-bisphosphate 1-phosphohydrolase n=1 Tax=Lactuca virosa TaxID=75947 RepID=A0AAU9LEJ2_9ASTR|nr:unnamed protein product [Lactuca virosa]
MVLVTSTGQSPTRIIFGIYNRLTEIDNLPTEDKVLLNSLQSDNHLVVVVYVLYYCTTILYTPFGSDAHAFTLDHSTEDFVLTHPDVKIPRRGQIYSGNDS